MGIDTYYYTCYGVKIEGLPDDLNEAYDKVYDAASKDTRINIIMDGMGCDYTYICKSFFKSGNFRWNDVYDTYVEIDITKLDDYKKEVSEAFLEHFPELGRYIEGEWKLFTFLHFT